MERQALVVAPDEVHELATGRCPKDRWVDHVSRHRCIVGDKGGDEESGDQADKEDDRGQVLCGTRATDHGE